MKKRRLFLGILFTLLAMATMLCGCSNDNNSSSSQAEVETLKITAPGTYINAGVGFLLIPRDSQGFVVETEGTLSARLWPQNVITGDINYDYLIQAWDDIYISKGDYTTLKGAFVKLMYDEELTDEDVYAYLEVTFTTTGNKTLTADLGYLLLTESSRC